MVIKMFNDNDDAKKAFKTQVENERRESSVKEPSSPDLENMRRENRKEAYREQQDRDLQSEGLPVREALHGIKNEVISRLHRNGDQRLPFPASRTIASAAGHRVKSGLHDFGEDVKRGFNGYSVGRKINQTIVEGIKLPEEDRRPRISVVVNNGGEAPKRKRSIYFNYNTLPSPEEIMGLPRRAPSQETLQVPEKKVLLRAQRRSQTQSLGAFRVPAPAEILGNSNHTINSFAKDLVQTRQRSRALTTQQISPPAVAQNGQRSFHAVRGGIAEYRGGQLVKIHPRKKRKKQNPEHIHDYNDPFAKFRL